MRRHWRRWALPGLVLALVGCGGVGGRKKGNQQACDEWANLSALSGAGPVKQAMGEALALLKRAA